MPSTELISCVLMMVVMLLFARDVLDEFVDKDRCLRVESRVSSSQKRYLGRLRAMAGPRATRFLHAATYLRRILFVGTRKVYTFDTESGPFLRQQIAGKHFQREHDVFENGERVE